MMERGLWQFSRRVCEWDMSGFSAGEVFEALVAGGAGPVVQNLRI